MTKQLTEEEAALKKRLEDLLLAVGETPEPPLPLACVLAVVETFPNAVYGGQDCEMAVLVDDNGAKHHVSVKSGQFHEGEFAVLIGMNACAKSTPVFEKWRGSASRTVNFSFGGGKVAFDAITFRPERGAYRYNPGVLIPLSEFPELTDCAVGDDVAERIGVMMHNEVVRRTIEKKEADEKAEKLVNRGNEKRAKYYQARHWRARCPLRFCGDAPAFVKRTRLEKLDAEERVDFCKTARIPHVKHAAFAFPLFEKAPTLPPLLKTAMRPNVSGGIRYGLVFRAVDCGSEVWFELPNPDYRPNPAQLAVDGKFDAMEKQQRERA